MIIKITDLKVDTLIGVYDHEQFEKQPLLISAAIEIQDAPFEKIEETLNYDQVAEEIIDYLSNGQYDLIEYVANEIVKIILKYEIVISVQVEIKKPLAMKDFDVDMVSVTQKASKKK